jgi:hypothetical protein
MKREKISGGSARAAQLMSILFSTPVIFLLFFKMDFSVNGVIFLFFILAIIVLFLYESFSYADIYKSDDSLVIKKIFNTKIRKISEVKEIDRALVPFSFYIKFENKYKVYFSSELRDIPKQFLSSDPDKVLNALKSTLSKEDN